MNLIDPTGMVVELTGSAADQQQFIETATEVTEIPLSEKGGQLVGEGRGVLAPSTSRDTLFDAIASSNTITIDAVSDDPNVFIDSFATGAVDSADIAGFEATGAGLGEAALTHVIAERAFNVANGGGRTQADFTAAHGAANRVSSGSISPGQSMTIQYQDASGRPVSTFRVNNNPVTGTPEP